MSAEQIKNGILAAIAAVGAGCANAMGGWDGAMKVLMAFMVADYITGVLVALVWKRSPKSGTGALDSTAGFQGLIKKGMILLVVFLAVQLDTAFSTQYIRLAVILFFTGNEGLSLLENLGLMGVQYPAFLHNALEALREKGDEGIES